MKRAKRMDCRICTGAYGGVRQQSSGFHRLRGDATGAVVCEACSRVWK